MGFRSLGLKGLAAICVIAPAIGTGYFAADPEHIVFATQAEAHMQPDAPLDEFPSSSYPRGTAREPAAGAIPPGAAHLFTRAVKGPRADMYDQVVQTSLAIKQPVRLASLGSGRDITGALPRDDVPHQAINRDGKADRVIPPLVKLSGMRPQMVDDRPSAALFLASLYSAKSYAFPGSEGEDGKPARSQLASKLPRGLKFQGETETEYQARQRRCLATAIYFEARGESERGQLAVAQVVMNRVRSSIYPDTICGVVFQGQWQRNSCQFSFACDGHADVPREKEQWRQANRLAKKVTDGEVWLDDIGHATHYHANYVKPAWRRQLDHVRKVGRHIFYRVRHEQIEDVLTAGGSPAQGLALAKNE